MNYFFLLILNIIPFAIGCIFYEYGFIVTAVFLIVQFFLNLFNYSRINKPISYLSLNFVMLLSGSVSIKICTWLYYNNISADPETLMLGNLGIIAGIVYVLVLTVMSVAVRKAIDKLDKNDRLN